MYMYMYVYIYICIAGCHPSQIVNEVGIQRSPKIATGPSVELVLVHRGLLVKKIKRKNRDATGEIKSLQAKWVARCPFNQGLVHTSLWRRISSALFLTFLLIFAVWRV